MAPVRLSEYRVGEAVLNRVMKDQLADVSSPEDLVTDLEKVKNEDEDEDEEKLILQLALIVRRIGEALKNDKEMKTMMGKMSNKSNYWKVVEKVFEDGLITWERIAVLFYVAGRMAVKVVIAHLPQYVKDILTWTLEYFKRNLLSWVKENGGWMNSFSELARVQGERMNSMSARSSGILLVFIGGFLLGCVTFWKLSNRT